MHSLYFPSRWIFSKYYISVRSYNEEHWAVLCKNRIDSCLQGSLLSRLHSYVHIISGTNRKPSTATHWPRRILDRSESRNLIELQEARRRTWKYEQRLKEREIEFAMLRDYDGRQNSYHSNLVWSIETSSTSVSSKDILRYQSRSHSSPFQGCGHGPKGTTNIHKACPTFRDVTQSKKVRSLRHY